MTARLVRQLAAPVYRRMVGPLTDLQLRRATAGRSDYEALSLRLGPVRQGARRYRLTGLAERCDWILLTDWRPPFRHWVRRTRRPSTIFVSTRHIFEAIGEMDRVLREGMLEEPFVLISASEDATLPVQVDARERCFTDAEAAAIERIATHPLLKAWYVENLAETLFPSMHPIPCGVLAPQRHDRPPVAPLLTERPLKVLCAHRVREGEQWATRRTVSELAGTAWSGFCHVPPNEIDQDDFFKSIERYSFVICAEGGGLEPSPKAWHALLHGAIPIIRRSAVTPGYADLPVVVVNDWNYGTIDPAKMTAWRTEMASHFDSPEGRRQLLRKLSADFWWERIVSHLAPAQDLQDAPLAPPSNVCQ